MLQSSHEPAPKSAVRTLKMHADAGDLPCLPLVTLRAQLATATTPCPADVRRAADAMLQRIDQYWRAISYCGPAGGKGELPCALPAPQFEGRYSHYHTGLRVTDPAHGPGTVWSEAQAICLSTALHLAQWELSNVLPDSTDLLRLGRLAAMSACKNESITGLPWGKTSRRLSTAGILKRVRKARAVTPLTYLVLHPETDSPSFHTQPDFERIEHVLEARARENNRVFQVCRPSSRALLEAA